MPFEICLVPPVFVAEVLGLVPVLRGLTVEVQVQAAIPEMHLELIVGNAMLHDKCRVQIVHFPVYFPVI